MIGLIVVLEKLLGYFFLDEFNEKYKAKKQQKLVNSDKRNESEKIEKPRMKAWKANSRQHKPALIT